LLTANALGSSSPKKRVNAVSTAVMSPRDTEGKYSVAVATKSAVLHGWGEGRGEQKVTEGRIERVCWVS
jgi:hypothetical protein